MFFYLPEARNRTLEEIDEMFEAGLPARKFASYKVRGFAGLDGDVEARKSIERGKEVEVLRSEKVMAEASVARD